MSKGASIPVNTTWENGQAYSICLPYSEQNLWFAIVTGLLVQLSYGYFWDSTSGDIDQAKEYGLAILNNWLDGGCAVPTCEEIASCINSNQAVREALNSWFASSKYNETLEYILGEMQKQVIVPPIGANCKDSAYSALVAIIDEIDASIIDFYEQAELVTNITEFASDIAEIAQGILASFGVLAGVGIATAIDAGASLINQIKDNLYEQYLAGMTQELKDEFVCDLLCDYNCEFTLENIRDYFKNAVSSSTEFDSYIDIFDYLVIGNFTGTLSVKASYYATLELVLALNRLFYAFTSQNTDAITRLRKVAQVGALSPSNAWEILCPFCGNFDIAWLASLPLVAPGLNSGDTLVSNRTLNDGAGSFIGYGQYLGGSIVRLSNVTVTITHIEPKLVNSISFYSRVNGGGTNNIFIDIDGTVTTFTRANNGTRVKHTKTFASPTNVTVILMNVSATQAYSGSYIEGIEIDYA